VIPSDATFAGTFPFAPHFTDAPGFRMHYVDEGPRGGEVILCLHGEPTWGYLFRHLISTLNQTHRVVVPDHMGFGKSETPEGRSYWLQDHIANLETFVLALGLTDITLVMHDFCGSSSTPHPPHHLGKRPDTVWSAGSWRSGDGKRRLVPMVSMDHQGRGRRHAGAGTQQSRL
jgi:hypothetical protein